MAVYYILMALILGLAYPMCIRKPSKKKNIIYIAVVFGYMFVMSSLRYGLGNDYFNYRTYLHNVMDNGLSVIDTVRTTGIEPGYVLLLKLTGLLGGDYLILNTITALLILVPTAYIIIKYSKMPWISAWLYLTVTFFYNSLNFTRQSLSVAVIFLGWRFFRDRKHIPAVLIILAAAMFHVSALILLPVYFLSLIKPSAKSLGIIGGAGVLAFIFSRQILSFVTTYILPRYAKYMDTIYLRVGLSWVFLLIPALMMILTLAAYFTGWKDKAPEAQMLANFSFYNFFIWLFIVKHFIIERFTMPIYIFILLAIPEILDCWKSCRLAPDKKVSGIKDTIYTLSKGGKRIAPAAAALVIVSTLAYNQFCVGEGVHGVFPYRSIFVPVSGLTDKMLETDYRALYNNADFMQFLGLANKGNYTIVASVNGDTGDMLEFQYRHLLKKLGFETDFRTLDRKSYIGVVSGGKAVFEKTGDEQLTENLSLYGGKISVTITSGGAVTGQPVARIIADGKEYAPNGSGINFAVFDNKLQKIVAAQSYDTSVYTYTYKGTDAFYGEILIEE